MKKLIGNKEFYKMVLLIAIPIIIQNGITSSLSFIDNIMIGKTGTLQMSGVSIANSLLLIFNLSIFGSLSGPGIFLAQFFGKKDDEGIRQSFRFKFYIGIIVLLIGLFVFYFFGETLISFYLNGEGNSASDIKDTLYYGYSYMKIMLIGLFPFMLSQVYTSSLRETGDTVLPMIASGIAMLLNFILNYCLIFGKFGLPCLGVLGAAIATVISRYVEMIVVILYTHITLHRRPFFKGIYSSLKVDIELAKNMSYKAIPLLANEVLWSGSLALINQSYSLRGLSAVAAMNICSTTTNLFMIICYAMGNSISIIIGQKLGSGNLQDAYDTDIKLIFFNFICCVFTGSLLIISSSMIPSLYNTSNEIRHIASSLLKIGGCMMPVQAVYLSCYFTLRAGGKTLMTFLFDSFYSVAVTFPLAYILTHFTSLPIVQVFLLVQAMDIIKGIVGAFIIKKGIWMNNLVG